MNRPISHKIGEKGEHFVKGVFADLGYACSDIRPDYGEDFFVQPDVNGQIDPFRVFIQVKSTESAVTKYSDWHIYEEAHVVRRWLLSNDMVVIVKCNFSSNECRFCIPEDDLNYWDIQVSGNVSLKPNTSFDKESAKEIIWRARIRNYDRIVRITQPNNFEDADWNNIPQASLFVLEFLDKLGLISNSKTVMDISPSLMAILSTTNNLFDEVFYDPVDTPDPDAYDQALYAACNLIVLNQIHKITGHNIGLSPFFLDQCSHHLHGLVKAKITHKDSE